MAYTKIKHVGFSDKPAHPDFTGELSSPRNCLLKSLQNHWIKNISMHRKDVIVISLNKYSLLNNL